jgi:hypothetical protein
MNSPSSLAPIAVPPPPSLRSASLCRCTISISGWQIAAPLTIYVCRLAAPEYFLLASASHCCTAIFSFGRCIPLPRHHLSIWLVHPIKTPQYFHLAGASLRRAAIYPFGWRIPSQSHNIFIWPGILSPRRHLFFRSFDQCIPSQCCNVFFWWVWSIAMWPPLIFRPAHSLAHGPLYYSGWRRIQSPIAPLNILAGAFSRPWPPLLLQLAHSIASSSFKGATGRVLSKLQNLCRWTLGSNMPWWSSFFAVFSTRPSSTYLPEHTVR